MATLVEMDLPGYPEVAIADREDARIFCRILGDAGVKVNIRDVES